MNLQTNGKIHSKWLLLLAISILTAVAVACGGGDSDDEDDGTATTTAQSPTAVTTATSTSPAADNATSTPGNTGDASGNALDCSAMSAVAGVPGLDIDAFTSSTPETDFARDVSGLFEDVIGEALDTSTSANCFYEASVNGEAAGLWMSFDLSEPAGPDAADRIEEELEDRGVTIGSNSAITGSLGETDFAFIAFESLPDIDPDAGGTLYVNGGTVVLVAGTDFDGESSILPTPMTSPGATPGTSPTAGGTATATGSPTTATTPVSPGDSVTASGMAGTLDAGLRPFMEQLLGVPLVLVSSFSSSVGDETAVILGYEYQGDPPANAGDTLADMITTLGGEIQGTSTFGEITIVNFTNLAVANETINGSVSTDSDTLTLTLQSIAS